MNKSTQEPQNNVKKRCFVYYAQKFSGNFMRFDINASIVVYNFDVVLSVFQMYNIKMDPDRVRISARNFFRSVTAYVIER